MARYTPAVQELANTFAETQTGPFYDAGGAGWNSGIHDDDPTATQAAAEAASGGDVQLRPGAVWAPGSNVTVGSARAPFRPLPGCLVKPASGVTVTIGALAGGVGRHRWIDLSDGGSVVFSSGTVRPEWFGATGENDQDDAPFIIQAAESLAARGRLLFQPGATYRLDTSAAWTASSYVTYVAWGAKFNCTFVGTAIDINDGADPESPSTTIRNNVDWNGGLVTLSADAKTEEDGEGVVTKSVAFKCYNFRNITVRRLRWEKFEHGVEFAGADTYNFVQTHGFQTTVGYYSPDWSSASGGNTISITFDRCHHSSNGQQAALLVEGYVFDLAIAGGSVNGNPTKGFHFKSVTGQTSSTFTIKKVHFEQGDGSTTYVHFEDTAGTGFASVDVADNSFTYGSPVGIKLERCDGVRIGPNRFAQTISGGGTPISVGSTCTRVEISPACRFPTGSPAPIVVASGARGAVSFGPPIPQNAFPVSGFDGDSLSTSSGTIDMSSAISAIFPTMLPPRGYWLNIQARDSGSAASTAARVRLSKGGITANSQRQCLLSLAGAPNDSLCGVGFFVPADDAGDINYDVIASGAGTLDVWIAVTAIAM